MVKGRAHGPSKATTCQLYMRQFHGRCDDHVEPCRARAFPVLKDLVVDRGAFDRIIQRGGFVSVNTGGAQDAKYYRCRNRTPSPRWMRRSVSDAGPAWRRARTPRQCCLSPPRYRTLRRCRKARLNGKRACCTWSSKWTRKVSEPAPDYFECEAARPKEISVDFIAKMNREFLRANVAKRE